MLAKRVKEASFCFGIGSIDELGKQIRGSKLTVAVLA